MTNTTTIAQRKGGLIAIREEIRRRQVRDEKRRAEEQAKRRFLAD